MTFEYARQWPVPRPVVDIPTIRLQWAHSVHYERDFLSEWQALDIGVDLARDFGHSQLSTDAFALPLRHKKVTYKVRFNPEVEVLMGMETDLHFQSLCIDHESLSHWPDKPWMVRDDSTSSESIPEEEMDRSSFMARRPIPHLRSDAVGTSASLSTAISSTLIDEFQR